MKHIPPAHRLVARCIEMYGHAQYSLLDYGCGNGALLHALDAQKILKYVGCDPSADAVAQGRKEHTADSVHFFHLDKAHTDLPRQQFDVIVMIGVLQYVPSKEQKQLLQQLHGALKPGGLFILTTMSNHTRFVYTDLYRLLIPHQTVSAAYLQALMRAAGLSLTVIKERGQFWAPLVSHLLVPCTDVFDYYVLGTRGGIGRCGTWLRTQMRSLVWQDMTAPTSTGYTLFAIAKKT